jgi:glucose/arabinose dehydrogenase
MKKSVVVLGVVFCAGQLVSQVVKIQTLSNGLLMPVGIHNSGLPNDNRLFILEKRGRIKIVDRNSGAIITKPFLDIYDKVYPVTSVSDERGLLGLAFHPDYATNGFFYVNYTNPAGKSVLARYQVSNFPDTADKSSEKIMLTVFKPFSNHNGGNLMFGPKDGYLYFSLGDGGGGGDPGNRAQNPDSLLGKMLRLDVSNGNAPYYFSVPSNPFYGSTAGRDEIFDLGLRNAWRCSFDRLTGDMWIADVGQNVWEEINFRSYCDTVGRNYGWRCFEANAPFSGGGCQSQSAYAAPVFSYSHALGCSVTGGYAYRGAGEGGLYGKYLFTDYCQGRIWAMSPAASGTWQTAELVQSTTQVNYNYSAFGEDSEGELYLAGISSGRIYTLRDTACAPVAEILAPDTLLFCGGTDFEIRAVHGSGLTYSWTVLGNGWSVYAGQGTSVLKATAPQLNPATFVVTVSNGTCSSTSGTVTVMPGVSLDGLLDEYCPFFPPHSFTVQPAGGTLSGGGISNGIFNPSVAGPGSHTITYTLADTMQACGYPVTGCILKASKVVFVDFCASINEGSLFSFGLFPNPGGNVLNLVIGDNVSLPATVEIFDAQGKTVRELVADDQKIVKINLGTATPGIYTIRLRCGDQVETRRLILAGDETGR